MTRDDKPITTEYIAYLRNANTLLYQAKEYSDEIAVHGIESFDLKYHIVESLDSIIEDVLTRGDALRTLCLHESKDGKIDFSIVDERGNGRRIVEDAIFTRRLEVECCALGIKRKDVHRAIRRLKEMKTDLSNHDWVRRTEIQRKIADKVGSFIFWTYSDTSTFTDAFLLIQQCEQILLASRFCKYMEDEINTFFVASGYEGLSISIPTYPIEEYSAAENAFRAGEISSEEFSKLVFHHS